MRRQRKMVMEGDQGMKKVAKIAEKEDEEIWKENEIKRLFILLPYLHSSHKKNHSKKTGSLLKAGSQRDMRLERV
jgi:hypothetical protein